jgi:hypothetical protein
MVGISTFRSDDAHAAYCQLSESDIETSSEYTHLFQRGRSFKASVCRVPRQLCPRAGTSVGQGRELAAATTVAGNGGVTEVVND